MGLCVICRIVIVVIGLYVRWKWGVGEVVGRWVWSEEGEEGGGRGESGGDVEGRKEERGVEGGGWG